MCSARGPLKGSRGGMSGVEKREISKSVVEGGDGGRGLSGEGGMNATQTLKYSDRDKEGGVYHNGKNRRNKNTKIKQKARYENRKYTKPVQC